MGCAAEPAELQDWANYVRTVVDRYKGKVEAYELWNEVHFSDLEYPYDASGAAYFYSGNVERMVDLARVAHRIIKEVDPAARLTSPSIHVYGDWIKKLHLYLNSGGAAYTDVVSFHFYASGPEDMLRSITAVREVMRQAGLGDAPLWNTESGFVSRARSGSDSAGGHDPEEVGAMIGRSFVLAAAAGIERFYWYAWDNAQYGLAEYRGRVPTAAAYAYASAAGWLHGAVVERCAPDRDGLWNCRINKEGRRAWIVWHPAQAREWTPPPAWQVKHKRALVADKTFTAASSSVPLRVGPDPVLLLGE
jgi:hypothetical protein